MRLPSAIFAKTSNGDKTANIHVDYRKDLDDQPKNPGQHAHQINWGDGLLPRVLALRSANVWSTSEMHPISEPQIRH